MQLNNLGSPRDEQISVEFSCLIKRRFFFSSSSLIVLYHISLQIFLLMDVYVYSQCFLTWTLYVVDLVIGGKLASFLALPANCAAAVGPQVNFPSLLHFKLLT